MNELADFVGGPLCGERRRVNGKMYCHHDDFGKRSIYEKKSRDGPFVYVRTQQDAEPVLFVNGPLDGVRLPYNGSSARTFMIGGISYEYRYVESRGRYEAWTASMRGVDGTYPTMDRMVGPTRAAYVGAPTGRLVP